MKFGHVQKAKFLGLKVTFTFHFFSSPFFVAFLASFFSFAGFLVDFILVGEVFRKILGQYYMVF